MINIDFFIINILTTNTMKTEGKKKNNESLCIVNLI